MNQDFLAGAGVHLPHKRGIQGHGLLTHDLNRRMER